VRKFNVDEAFINFERSHLSFKKYPHYYDNIEKSMELFDLGFCYPLMDRDAEGRRVIFIKWSKNDPEKFTVADSMRLIIHVIMILLEEEESQVSGFVLFFDVQDINTKHILTPVEARDLTTILKSCSPVRIKEFLVVNLPSYANIILELVKPFLSEKLKGRLNIVADDTEMKKNIDEKLLPNFFGGKYSEAELKENFMKLRSKYLGLYQKSFECAIDMDKVDWEKIWVNKDTEVVGSFRKLDID
jgi:hypothetical protein